MSGKPDLHQMMLNIFADRCPCGRPIKAGENYCCPACRARYGQGVHEPGCDTRDQQDRRKRGRG